MNPYLEVTEVMVASVEEAIRSVIGTPWDGMQHPIDFLTEVAGPELAKEYRRAVSEYMEWRGHYGHPSSEYLFQIGSHQLVTQFIYRWQANGILDALTVLLTVTRRLPVGVKAICDLGCGSGVMTAAIGRILSCRVVGVDRQRYWEGTNDHPGFKLSDNVNFLQRDIAKRPAPEAFDIVYAVGLKEHCDAEQFWQAMKNWCRSDGFVLMSGGFDATSAESLLTSFEHMSGLWPISCAPIGGLENVFLPDNPGTLLICQRMEPPGILLEHCRLLVDEYRSSCATAKAFLNDEAIPYQQRTFAKWFLHNRSFRNCEWGNG